MEWKPAPLIKVYEALGSLANGRVKLDGNEAKVFSSSGNKHYDVAYDPDTHAITANDNGSYWVGYLGYPAISFILACKLVPYDERLPEYLKGFAWKDINQKFKNDFAKTQGYIDAQVVAKHAIKLDEFHHELAAVLEAVNGLKLRKLGATKKPPAGY